MNKYSKLSQKAQINILLVENSQEQAQSWVNVLAKTKYTIENVSRNCDTLLAEIVLKQPDVIIIDTETPDANLLECLKKIFFDAPRPIVVFSELDDTEAINQFVKYGVSAYVVGEVNKARIKSVLDIAIARFDQYQGLKVELDKTKEKLSNQKYIERAKHWLMQAKQLSEDEAYHSIRKMAMDKSLRIDDVAKNILQVADMLEAE